MASVQIERKWCPQCDAHVKAERHGASHLFHLVMSCVTVGLWLIVWYVVGNNRKFHCSTCGSKVKSRKPMSILATDSVAAETSEGNDENLFLEILLAVIAFTALVALFLLW